MIPLKIEKNFQINIHLTYKGTLWLPYNGVFNTRIILTNCIT